MSYSAKNGHCQLLVDWLGYFREHMLNKENISFILIIAIFITGGIFHILNKSKINFESETCPIKTSTCPDGSVVKRIPPACDLPECPEVQNLGKTRGLEEIDDFLFQEESIEYEE